MRTRLRPIGLLAALLAAGAAEAAPAPASPAPAASRTLSFAEGTCNTLPPVPLSFSIPGDYVVRAPASHKTSVGCLWGTAADLDRAMKDPKGIDFSALQRGLFWARPAGNVGFDQAKNHFYDGRGADEAAMKRQFEKAGARNAVMKRGAVGAYPTLQFTGDLAAGPNHKPGRLFMMYLGLGSGTKALLINYHPPARQTPSDDQIWQQFVSGLRSTAAAR